MASSPASTDNVSGVQSMRRSRTLRVAIWSGLILLLALGFVGYLTPGVKLNWETIATMCGF